MVVGDIVISIKYGEEVLLKIIEIRDNGYYVQGLEYRISAVMAENELQLKEKAEIIYYARGIKKDIKNKIDNIAVERLKYFKNINEVATGKVLHIDADSGYLNMCVDMYKKLDITVYGELVKESEQPLKIMELLKKYRPDIVVITGHDALDGDKDNIESYESSKYFVETIQTAREYEPSKDNLVIIAGACQSYYEAIINAGANYASSPGRMLIHALDPMFIAQKIAIVPFDVVVDVKEAVGDTATGLGSYGGVATRGTSRLVYPVG